MDRYVVEIAIAAPVYIPDDRKVLSTSEYYGCHRAYWNMDREADEHGTPRPLGICLTAELSTENLEAAEDAALDVGRRFSQVLDAYSGTPLQPIKLKRLGRIGSSEGLFEQYEYYYLEGADSLPHVMLRSYQLETLLS